MNLTKKNFDLIRFPNGEFKLILLSSIKGRDIEWKYGDTFANGEKLLSPSEELVAIIQLNEIAKKHFWDKNEEKYLNVFTDFLPFKRQDKDKLLGEIKFDNIYESLTLLNIIDFAPHNKKLFSISTIQTYNKHIEKDDIIVFPDYTASQRIRTSQYDNEKEQIIESIIFEKERDANTGELKFVKQHLSQVKDKECVILDDIISFGGTFKYVASELKKYGATYIKLIVNHIDRDLKGKVLYNKKEMKESGINEIVVLNGGINIERIKL